MGDFTFLKLHKWYQIAQNITYYENVLKSEGSHPSSFKKFLKMSKRKLFLIYHCMFLGPH